ncbi:MAG: von Willebrand factor type A domain-containing protein [Bradymonadaceae bacterium]
MWSRELPIVASAAFALFIHSGCISGEGSEADPAPSTVEPAGPTSGSSAPDESPESKVTSPSDDESAAEGRSTTPTGGDQTKGAAAESNESSASSTSGDRSEPGASVQGEIGSRAAADESSSDDTVSEARKQHFAGKQRGDRGRTSGAKAEADREAADRTANAGVKSLGELQTGGSVDLEKSAGAATTGRAEEKRKANGTTRGGNAGVRKRAAKVAAPSRSAGAPSPTKPRSPRPEPEPMPPFDDDPSVNRMTDPSVDAKSTFAADVDTGSYTSARQSLRNGRMPEASDVRVEEFVNYFEYDYPEPDAGPFSVSMEAAPSPLSKSSNRYLFRVGVQGKTLDERDERPVHLTFLIDVSGSMRGPNKLGLVKRSLRVLVRNLEEGDTVAIATFASGRRRVLPPTDASHRRRILGAIESLESGGSTAMGSGLDLAYDLANENFRPEHVNRVVVLGDGGANVGATRHEAMLEKIRGQVERGITLSTVGFGRGPYRDGLMEQLADNGDGNYYYIDGAREARNVFGNRLSSVLRVIAEEVKIQVQFDESNVQNYRLIGYENRDVKDRNFRNPNVDAGEIGPGHTVTAMYEVELAGATAGELATVRIRHQPPPHASRRGEAYPRERGFTYRSSQLHSDITHASRDFQFAAAVTGFAELLRRSPYAESISYELVEQMAAGATRDRERRRQFVDLVRTAQRLRGGERAVRDR